MDKFKDVDEMITRANQAATEEKQEIDKYNALTKSDNEMSPFEGQYEEEQEKLKYIVAAERKATKIKDAGSLWAYEKKPPPGENVKRRMSNEMSSNLTATLNAHIEELDNACLGNNLSKVREEILKAKEYVNKLKPGLKAYNNVSKLEELIIEVENTIIISKSKAKRPQKITSDSSNKDTPPKEAVAKPAKNRLRKRK